MTAFPTILNKYSRQVLGMQAKKGGPAPGKRGRPARQIVFLRVPVGIYKKTKTMTLNKFAIKCDIALIHALLVL